MHERARDSKIHNDGGLSPEIDAEHRRERSTLGAEPFPHTSAALDRLPARCVARDRDRQCVRHRDQSRQRSMNRSLTHAQIIILGSRLLLVHRDGGAERQSQTGYFVQNLELDVDKG